MKPEPENLPAQKNGVLSRQRQSELNAKLAALSAANRKKGRQAFAQKRRKKDPRIAPIIAYDFETTRIAEGTPEPLYLTAFSEDPEFSFDAATPGIEAVHSALTTQFLTEELRGTKFVGWNANRFDAYFVAAALVRDSDFVIRPFLTRSNALRGMRVSLREDSEKRPAWMFLDGLAMLGLEGVSLAQLLDNFAPDHKKLTGVIDFDKEEFDANNARHRDYAYRDSVGLWHAMQRAQSIMIDHFDEPLAVTMGGACIKVFQANIPREVKIKPLSATLETTFREYIMRGGYCFCMRAFSGAVWKYDVNQAYAAAMREDVLPCGECIEYSRGVDWKAPAFVARITATHATNTVPFYYRVQRGLRLRSEFSLRQIDDTWLTSTELHQLKREGWQITIIESACWSETFSMAEYVGKLETLRLTCDGGPKGPIGTMTKAVGNHSYGKTVEEIAPIEFILADDPPEGYAPYYGDGDDPIEHVYYRFIEDQRSKDYHAVQIGAFITASVRMKVRRAALLNPGAWLYADTDCVIFSQDVTAQLDTDPARYGAWKVEESGTPFRIIAKKVYAEISDKPKKRSAKGMNVKHLDGTDFLRWYNGLPPRQNQVQRNNFLAAMNGANMFRGQRRRGTGEDVKIFNLKNLAFKAGQTSARCLGCGSVSRAFRNG